MPSTPPSRSQKKREAKSIEGLVHELILLSGSQLRQAPLDDDIREELLLAQKIKQHGGKKRQIKLVSKLLRERDAQPIEEYLGGLKKAGFEETAAFHQLERLRSLLLQADSYDEALEEVLERFPELDRTAIVALTEQHRVSGGKKYSRELFRILKAAFEREQWKNSRRQALEGAEGGVNQKIET